MQNSKKNFIAYVKLKRVFSMVQRRKLQKRFTQRIIITSMKSNAQNVMFKVSISKEITCLKISTPFPFKTKSLNRVWELWKLKHAISKLKIKNSKNSTLTNSPLSKQPSSIPIVKISIPRSHLIVQELLNLKMNLTISDYITKLLPTNMKQLYALLNTNVILKLRVVSNHFKPSLNA